MIHCPDCGRIIYWDDDMKDPLTLSTAEAGRFLHTAPSALKDTSVSAFELTEEDVEEI